MPRKKKVEAPQPEYIVTNLKTGESREIEPGERLIITSRKQEDYIKEVNCREQNFIPADECKEFAKYWASAAVYISDQYMQRDQYMPMTLFFCLLKYVDYDNVLRKPNGRPAKVSDIIEDLGKNPRDIRDSLKVLFEDGLLGKVDVNKYRVSNDEFGSIILVNPYVFCRTKTPLKLVVDAFKETQFNPEFNPNIIEIYQKYLPCVTNSVSM